MLATSEPREFAAPAGAARAYSARSKGSAAVGGEPADTVLVAMKRAGSARKLELAGDARLARLAEWFAAVTQRVGGSPPLEAIDFAARHLGMIEPLPALLVTVQRDGRWEPPLESLFEHAPRNIRYNRVGVAVIAFGSVRVAGVGLSSSHVDTSYVPRSLATGSRTWFDGVLGPGYRHPELAVTLPDGTTRRTPLGVDGAFSTLLEFPNAGLNQVEILASGPSGLEVVANFPVYVGGVPPSSAVLIRRPAESAEAAVSRLRELLNGERRKQGLRPLVFDARLSAVAAAHSADMAEQHFFGHESPTQGDPMRRARVAGISVKQLGENVGRGPSAAELHHLLMGSPGHRGNILKPEFTHVGIGVVADDRAGERVLLATQLFAAVPRGLPARQFNSTLLALVNQSRSERQAPPLELDAELERVACADAAAGLLTRTIEPGAEVSPESPDIQSWRTVLSGAYDPEDAAREPALHVPAARRVGVCVTASDTAAAFTARTVVIVVSASSFPRGRQSGVNSGSTASETPRVKVLEVRP